MPDLMAAHDTDMSMALDLARPLLMRIAAGNSGRMSVEDYDAAIRLGTVQLWLALDGDDLLGICLTQIVPYPRLRALNVLAVAGHHFRRWLGLREQVYGWAKAQGCSLVEQISHPAMQRLLPDFKSSHVYLERVL